MPEIRFTSGRKASNSVAWKFKEKGVKLLDQCHRNWRYKYRPALI